MRVRTQLGADVVEVSKLHDSSLGGKGDHCWGELATECEEEVLSIPQELTLATSKFF